MYVTKLEIDTYFKENQILIKKSIASNKYKCVTTNDVCILSDVYLACINSSEKIINIEAFVKMTISNIYRWNNSKFNRLNKVKDQYLHEDISHSNDEDDIDVNLRMQELQFLLEKYRLNNSKPSERVFFDLYVNQGVRSVRALQKRLGVSSHGSYTLIKEFKSKIKEYERKEQG